MRNSQQTAGTRQAENKFKKETLSFFARRGPPCDSTAHGRTKIYSRALSARGWHFDGGADRLVPSSRKCSKPTPSSSPPKSKKSCATPRTVGNFPRAPQGHGRSTPARGSLCPARPGGIFAGSPCRRIFTMTWSPFAIMMPTPNASPSSANGMVGNPMPTASANNAGVWQAQPPASQRGGYAYKFLVERETQTLWLGDPKTSTAPPTAPTVSTPNSKSMIKRESPFAYRERCSIVHCALTIVHSTHRFPVSNQQSRSVLFRRNPKLAIPPQDPMNRFIDGWHSPAQQLDGDRHLWALWHSRALVSYRRPRTFWNTNAFR